MNLKILFANLFLLLACFAYGNQTDSLLKELDLSIKKKDLYFSEKENNLLSLKRMLDNAGSKTDQFQASQKLMKEYSYFVNDSALHYSKKSFELATELDNKDYITETILDRVRLLSNSELFYESFKMLESIDISLISDKNKAIYYETYIYVLKNQINDINDMYHRDKYYNDLKSYIDAYLTCESVNNLDYKKVLAFKYYLDGRVEDVDKVIHEILNDPLLTPNWHAEFLFNIGRTFLEAGTEHQIQAKYYLMLASIEYNRLAITKNPAIIFLGKILFDEGDSKRAYEYINLALLDAGKFNNNHRLRDAEKAYSLIQNTYYAQIEQQQKVLKYYSILLTISFIALSITIISFYKKNKVLKKTKIALSESIVNLKESSYMMEAFVGHYLDLYYSYIIKLNDYKKYILKRLNGGKYVELIKSETASLLEANSNDDKIFTDFDKTFLSIYPNFIESVNKLLSESNQFNLRYDKKNNCPRMNTEIRILALIKLGISDNKKIALFLKKSMQTIYNYRSKIKLKAIDENTFESEIKLIFSTKEIKENEQ